MRSRPTDNPQNENLDWSFLRELLPWVWQWRWRAGLSFVLLLLAKAATVLVPLVLREVVDSLDGDTTLVLPVGMLLAYGGLRLASSFFRELQNTVFAQVRHGVMRAMSVKVVRHLHSLSLRYHLERKTGAITRDIGRGTSSVATLLNYTLFNILPTLIEVAMVAAILTSQYSVAFAVVTVVTFSAYVVLTFGVTRWRMKYRVEMNRRDSEANSDAIDGLLNYETVKYFNNEAWELERYDRSLRAWESAAVKSQASLSLLNVGQGLIIAGGVTAMMMLAAQGVVDGSMSVGDLVAVNAFLLQVFIPLGFLGTVYSILKHALADMERMFKLLAEEPEVVEAENPLTLGASDLQSAPVSIEFDGVDFAYNVERRVLKQVGFKVDRGARVALVGPSGSGKSTIARLLYRFYDTQQGSICLAGRELRDLCLDDLRSLIGIVPQDTVLFNESLRYNLAYAKQDATPAEIEEAAEMAGIHEFIAGLPDGYDTVVGERGLKLSGGERQRVSIARALLKDPPILIFDEATSALDSQTEQHIVAAMRRASESRTTLTIAHRLSSVADSDLIIVLREGEIVEQGTHVDLLEKQGLYAELWEIQQSTESNDVPVQSAS